MSITRLHPADDPAKAYFAGRQFHVVPTGTYDSDGTEVLGISPELSALLLVQRISGELSGRDPFPKARVWWGQLKAMARQRGIHDQHIRQLERALAAEGPSDMATLRALNRWTPKFSPNDMVQAVFKVVPA
ncbi:hypothetical protein JCM19379_12020 [Methyloparacoccus murrellii]